MSAPLTPSCLCAIVALVVFILAALAFAGNLTGLNGHLLLAVGLAALAAAGAL